MPTSTPTPRPRPAAASARSSAPAKIPAPAKKAAKISATAKSATAKPAKATRPAAAAKASKPAAAKASKPTARAAATKPATTAKATRPAAAKSPAPPASGPAIGSPAPDFSLAADDGRTYSLAGLKGSRFVLYFYPRDSTPGCTTEACDFRDRHAAFTAAKVPVLGVSGDDLRSHAKFRGKHSLPFPLLSDPDHRVAAAYGAYGEKTMYGRKMEGILRSTFVIGPTGLLESVWRPVKVPGHAEAVLQVIRGTK